MIYSYFNSHFDEFDTCFYYVNETDNYEFQYLRITLLAKFFFFSSKYHYNHILDDKDETVLHIKWSPKLWIPERDKLRLVLVFNCFSGAYKNSLKIIVRNWNIINGNQCFFRQTSSTEIIAFKKKLPLSNK